MSLDLDTMGMIVMDLALDVEPSESCRLVYDAEMLAFREECEAYLREARKIRPDAVLDVSWIEFDD